VTLTAIDVAALAARAATPLERARTGADEPAGAPDDGGRERRLARWRGLLGGEAGLDRRLELAGLGREHLERALGAVPAPAVTGGEWSTFAGVLAGVDAERTTWRFVDAARPVPWDAALAPLVAAASALLEERAGTGLELLEPAARADLERTLLERLAELASPTLRRLYERVPVPPAADDRPAAEAIAEGRRRRDGFCREVVVSAYGPLLAEHPVLGRVLATAIHLWLEHTAEFLARLDADLGAIAAELPGVGPDDRVARLRGGVSDPHHRGRSAFILAFPSGWRVVYKPRELRGETAWFALLAWLAREAALPAARSLAVLERDGYGWVQFAEAAPPQGEQERARYAERCGTLLALCYALGGTDVHFENVVPIGDEPVLVDLETVMHPHLSDPDADGSAGTHSVLSVGLLPSWIELVPDVAFDMSAVGAASGQLLVRFSRVAGAPAGDTGSALGQHADALVEGFRAGYEALRRVAPALSAPDGPLARFAHADMRLVVRPTRTYAKLLAHLTTPERVRDGRDWGIELDALAHAGVGDERAEALWPVIAAEVAAVARLDVPHFTVRADGHAVELDGGGRLAGAIAVSPLEAARRRIGRLDDDDRDRQLALLEATLTARSAAARGAGRTPSRHPLPVADTEPLALVRLIADEIVRRAEPVGDGLAWMVYDGDLAAGTVGVREAGPGLASGSSGIALVLALAARALGDDDLAVAARAGYARALAKLAGSVPRGWGRLGPGARSGMGGVLFALAEGARALDDAALGQAAARLADAAVAPLLRRETRTSVADGLAGAALGLRAAGDVAEGAAALAGVCAERLGELGAQVPSLPSPPWWSESASAGTPGPRRPDLDELAAGRAGEIDALTPEGNDGADVERPDEARRAARALAAEARARGGVALRLPPHGPVCLPGLTHGLAGVAYALLRCDQPDLPSLGALRPAPRGSSLAGLATSRLA
jgi:hypothetical protein